LIDKTDIVRRVLRGARHDPLRRPKKDKEHREDYEVIMKKKLNPECPECGIDYEEGCIKCHTCGYSEC